MEQEQKNGFVWIIAVIALVLLAYGAWKYLETRKGENLMIPGEVKNLEVPVSGAIDSQVSESTTTPNASPESSPLSTKTPPAITPTKNMTPQAPTGTHHVSEKTLVTLVTNKGTIKIALYPNDAPKATENFVNLSKSGFYNGLIFHRVIHSFMIQGGDPTGTGMGDPGYKFDDEINPASPIYKTGYKKGVVAMANSGPNTNGSQFFIMHEDTPLPSLYVIFGHVVEGQSVVDAIANTETGAQNRPIDPVIIQTATVTE